MMVRSFVAAWCGVTLLWSGAAFGQAGFVPLAPEVAGRERVPCDMSPPAVQAGKSAWVTNLWPAGVVPFEFDANTDASMQSAMRAAMDVLEGVASIHFVERTGQANYLTIRNSTGNNSPVGMVGGAQTVNIYNWNYTYIMCHELMHSLGVWHEQQRTDRDTYVQINLANVETGREHNFTIAAGSAPHGAYDFDSVMHYDAMAFSDNGQPTITVLPPNQSWQSLIGQTTHLSTGDIAGLQSRYAALQSAPWTQRTVTGPTARDGHAMAYDAARHYTVLFGGFTAATTRNAETWEWNGTAWAQRTVTGPTARGLHAMAYDSARSKVVLFGGSTASSSYNNETWEWNGTAWTQRAVTGPSARNSHAMAFDSNRNVTVLFGGMTGSTTRSGETWEWNGTAWTLRSSAGPSARAGMAMSYDSARRVTVLEGGQSSAGVQGDTWEWNGTAWTLRNSSGPSARTQGAMTYNPTRALTSLFGGTNGTTGNNENWDWSGSAWAQRTSGGPTLRSGHAMAHDSTRGVTVLFGGISAGTRSSQTWELGVPCSAPTIALQPAADNACTQGAATFTTTAWGNGMLSYQWKKGTTVLADLSGRRAGCTTPTLTLTGITTGDAGTYTCEVTDLCGTTVTNGAALVVNTTPTPVSVLATPNTVCAGDPSTLTASAPGQMLVWYSAATNTIVTSPVRPTVTTSYYAVANPFGCPSARSQQVTVTVLPAAVTPQGISATPSSYCPGSPPASVTLEVTGGSGTTVVWSKSEGPASGGCGAVAVAGNGPSLTVTPPTVTTTYYAKYTTGSCGESACAAVTITVGSACAADLGGVGGVQGGDCLLDNNDFVVFIDLFFTGSPLADKGMTGGEPGSDGVFDNNDFVVFVDQFFAGCP